MKATFVRRFGDTSAIEIVQLPVPEPAAGEVLVRVRAAGVGPWDGWVRSGKSALPQPLPLTLGADLSGVVERVGPGVTEFLPGDPVFGITNGRFTGAQAQYAIAEVSRLAKKPFGLSDIEAASVPVVAVTAWQMLFVHGKAQPGQTVLIHGGAGNVGAYAVQLALDVGLKVIATVAPDEVETAQKLGATKVIDFTKESFDDGSALVDLVIDTVGGATQERSFKMIAPGGVLVSSVSEPDKGLASAHGVRAMFMLVDVRKDVLTQIAQKFDRGELRHNVGTILSMEDVHVAHEMMEGLRSGRRGKIVLNIS